MEFMSSSYVDSLIWKKIVLINLIDWFSNLLILLTSSNIIKIHIDNLDIPLNIFNIQISLTNMIFFLFFHQNLRKDYVSSSILVNVCPQTYGLKV